MLNFNNNYVALERLIDNNPKPSCNNRGLSDLLRDMNI